MFPFMFRFIFIHNFPIDPFSLYSGIPKFPHVRSIMYVFMYFKSSFFNTRATSQTIPLYASPTAENSAILVSAFPGNSTQREKGRGRVREREGQSERESEWERESMCVRERTKEKRTKILPQHLCSAIHRKSSLILLNTRRRRRRKEEEEEESSLTATILDNWASCSKQAPEGKKTL